MTIHSEVLDQIWTQLESPYPGRVYIWDWYYLNYGYTHREIISSPYFETVVNELLLILCSEGESIT